MARNTYPLVQETSTLSADGRSWLRVMAARSSIQSSRYSSIGSRHGGAH